MLELFKLNVKSPFVYVLMFYIWYLHVHSNMLDHLVLAKIFTGIINKHYMITRDSANLTVRHSFTCYF